MPYRPSAFWRRSKWRAKHQTVLSTVLGTLAVTAAFANIVGGFMISDRMLKMFKKRSPHKAGK